MLSAKLRVLLRLAVRLVQPGCGAVGCHLLWSQGFAERIGLYDIAVVEPDHGYDPQRLRDQAPGSELYAYASVAGAAGARLLRSCRPHGRWRAMEPGVPS
jgi:hypothetical protein